MRASRYSRQKDTGKISLGGEDDGKASKDSARFWKYKSPASRSHF